MRIIQINNTDLPGARFNGYNLMENCLAEGYDIKQIVLDKYSDNSNVISLRDSVDTVSIYQDYEAVNSIRNVIIPFGRKIMRMQEFLQADIIHYHLIHNGLLSLFDLPGMLARKRSVWTIHDPWIFTGHCIYPIDCKKYLSGCERCDFLNRNFSMKEDNSHNMWMLKKRIFQEVHCDIVVASNWMANLVKNSPLTNHWKKLHIIPFGINLSLYKDANEKCLELRKKHNIKKDDIVLFFRSDRSEYKGLEYIKSMLRRLKTKKKVVLLNVGEKGLLNDFKFKYKIVEKGWLNDEKELALLYGMADMFLMPSKAEAFGVMAIEAMAANLPVVVMEGTALPDVVMAPRYGLSFPRDNVEKFTEIVKYLVENDDKRKIIGVKCGELAEEKYSEKLYFSKMLDLYHQMMEETQ